MGLFHRRSNNDSTKKLLLSDKTFVHHHNSSKGGPKFRDKYDLGEKIPGLVRTHECLRKATQHSPMTVKIFPRPDMEHAFYHELTILKALNHDFFPRVHESFQDDSTCYIVMEPITVHGGCNLMDAIQKVDSQYSEKGVADMMITLLQALDYAHNLQVTQRNGTTRKVVVCHGSIHAKNWFVGLDETQFQTDPTTGNIVGPAENITMDALTKWHLLVGFENAEAFSPHEEEAGDDKHFKEDATVATEATDDNSEATERLGPDYQSHYFAPEYYEQGGSPKVDMYACGILAYFLLTGRHPFHEIPQPGATDFPNDIDWQGIKSPALKRFIEDCLHMDPALRPTAAKALKNHNYDLSLVHATPGHKDDSELKGVMERLSQARKKHKLEEAVTYYLTNELAYYDDFAIIELAAKFDEIDANHDGYLTREEIRDSLSSLNLHISEKKLDSILNRMDLNQDGKIDRKEFLATAAETAKVASQEKLKAAFDEFDQSNTGYITVSDLQLVFNNRGEDGCVHVTKDMATAMIAKSDQIGDGKLCFEEFKAMMLGYTIERKKLKLLQLESKKTDDQAQTNQAQTNQKVIQPQLMRTTSQELKWRQKRFAAGYGW